MAGATEKPGKTELCEVGKAEYNGVAPKFEPVDVDIFITL